MATYLDAREALNVEVSCFANYNTPGNPKPVNLYLWLTNTKYRDKVVAIRVETEKLKRDALKATLPAITPSGVFTYRQASELIRHSGWLQFDIDFKDNPHIRNYADLKAQLAKLPFVAYCGLSVSGTGYWGLVPIAHPERHGQHFDALMRVFAHYKINLDDKPRNVASLRGYSYDPEGYFAEKVMLFELYDEPRPVATREFTPSSDADTERQRVEACISEVSKRSIDITSGYNYWYAIGCDLASTFGEGGRDYFHVVSQVHSEYNPASCDKQYTHCLRSYKEVQLSVFFGRCRDAGVSWKELLPWEPVERTTPLTISSKTRTRLTGKTGKSNNEVAARIESAVSVQVVATVEDILLAPPGTMIRPDPAKIETLVVEPCDSYPVEWDESNSPDAIPQIKQQSFFEWQRSCPPFNQLGLASLKSPP